MHTTDITGDDGETLRVHHNGDWSGEAIVMHIKGEKLLTEFRVEDGRLFLLLSLRIIGSRLESRLENMLEEMEEKLSRDSAENPEEVPR